MALNFHGDRVRELRQANGWSLRAFADVAQVSHGYLSKIENNKPVVSPEVMWQLANALGVDLNVLTGEQRTYVAALTSARRSPMAPHARRTEKAVA